jgi:membrane protease YdiL (CAAX protease family)
MEVISMFELFQKVILFLITDQLPAKVSIFTTIPIVEEMIAKLGLLNAAIRGKAMRLIVGIVPSLFYAVIEQLGRADGNPWAWALTVPMHVLCGIVGARFRYTGFALRIIMHAVWNFAVVHVMPITDAYDGMSWVLMFGLLAVYCVLAIVVWLRQDKVITED